MGADGRGICVFFFQGAGRSLGLPVPFSPTFFGWEVFARMDYRNKYGTNLFYPLYLRTYSTVDPIFINPSLLVGGCP